VVVISAKTEAELADMSDEDRQLFLAEMGQTESGLARLIRAAFALLGLQTYFTAGPRKCAPGRSTSATPRRRRPA
jgi:ribosome-binding ATPase YchF (GTP1/OBG family)